MKSNQLYFPEGLSQHKPLYLPPVFSSQCSSIDWKFFSSISVEKLANSFDYDILQKILPFIAHCNVTAELNVDIESNFAKLYRLAQILIEYLIHSQTQLFTKVSLLHSKNHQLRKYLQSHNERRHAQIPYLQNVSTSDDNRPPGPLEALKHSLLLDTQRIDPITSRSQTMIEDLIKRVLEHSSIVEEQLQQRESEILVKRHNNLESFMREEMQRITRECEIFKQRIVAEQQQQQDTNKTAIEECLHTCRNFIDEFKVQTATR
ncbi:Zinc finger protein DZIP1L [Oopsacas minuta]|uniref:Zinc finger protein DZIP1L n=1 Tax=Oopsacas minuta TaxID=111878 RepID=A0AAV7JIY5_9METZ|nr:Zinc finger protein DZIP1L [Oopsacas minuta]